MQDTNLIMWTEMGTPGDILRKIIHNAGGATS